MTALLYEHGPYVFRDDGLNLAWNEFAWNSNASVIYLDSPAGTPFSIAGNSENYHTNDSITTFDSLAATQIWLMKFPEYRKNPFYIAGESYGGIYVPLLALSILQYNAEMTTSAINLKGILIGNGSTDWEILTRAQIEMTSAFGFYLSDFKAKLETDCEGAQWSSEVCSDDINEVYGTLMRNVNPYDVFRTCYHPATEPLPRLRYRSTIESKLSTLPPVLQPWEL